MEYIDKNPYLEKEREIDIAYLQDCFNDESHSFYPEIDTDQSYSNFSSKKYRKGVDGWENLLLLEQNGRCCYCMRKLDLCARNIEHVVPRNINTGNPEEEFQKYAKAACIIEDNVILASDFTKTKFEDSEDIRKAAKMPHRIALQNLLVSCNGKFGNPSSGCCCNNARSNDFLQPLMLMQNGANKVYYDGISGVVAIYPFEPSWGKMLETLNDDTYKEIRVLWHKIWKHKDGIDLDAFESYEGRDRIILMKTIFEVDNFLNIPDEYKKYAGVTDKNSLYWKLLMDFDWFLTYEWKS